MRTTSSRRPVAAVIGLVLVALSFAVPASAKEIGSGGGGGGGGTACSPVTSLKAKGDARAGETGVATIDVSYGVKSCTSSPVTADVRVAEYLNPAVIVWDNPNAPLNSSFTVAGVRVRVTYLVTVTVRDAASGATVGSQTLAVAAIPKGV